MKALRFWKTKTGKGKIPGQRIDTQRERLFELLIHDLRGPLSVVSTSANHLLQKPDIAGPLTERQRDSLERISRNTRKAQTLIQEMIELFLTEEGLFKKDHFPIAKVLKASIADALELTCSSQEEMRLDVENEEALKGELKTRDIGLEISGWYCDHPFCHDFNKIQQILRNLVSNALKYRSKYITISVKGEKDLIVSVEDDGPGLPSNREDIPFERFARWHDREACDPPGLGLGLAGVKAMIDAMGGEISVLSCDAAGTCFTLRIPSLHDRKEEKDMAESILKGKRILAVDDEPDVLAILEDEIKDSCPDCTFETAGTYEEAAKKLQSQSYDLVVLDIMGVRGFDLLDLAVKKNLKVAMLTAHALSPETLKRAFEMKARSYLPKEKLGEIIPFLEDVLTYEYLPGWRRLFEKLKGFFDQKFESDWEKKTGLDWREWTKWGDTPKGW